MSIQTELIFLTELKKEHPLEHVYVVMDNAPCHKPQILHKLPGLSIVYLPPYSPELNPVERFFEEVRRFTANRVFTTMEALEERLTKFIKSLTEDWVKNLTCYEWIERRCVGVN
jgi:transposase